MEPFSEPVLETPLTAGKMSRSVSDCFRTLLRPLWERFHPGIVFCTVAVRDPWNNFFYADRSSIE